MDQRPPIIKPGAVSIPAKVFSENDTFTRANRPVQSSGVLVARYPGGTGLRAKRVAPSFTRRVASALHPFQLYQHTPDPESPATEDWRTFRVRYGFVNNSIPQGVDGVGGITPIDIIVDAETTDYKVWLEVKFNTSTALMTTIKIDKDPAGWTDYPDQPDPNNDGEPPEYCYILVGLITTGKDSPSTDTDYHKVTIIEGPLIKNIFIGSFAYDSVCSTTTGMVQQQRIAWM